MLAITKSEAPQKLLTEIWNSLASCPALLLPLELRATGSVLLCSLTYKSVILDRLAVDVLRQEVRGGSSVERVFDKWFMVSLVAMDECAAVRSYENRVVLAGLLTFRAPN